VLFIPGGELDDDNGDDDDDDDDVKMLALRHPFTAIVAGPWKFWGSCTHTPRPKRAKFGTRK